jgi:hypothetical protein
MRRLFLAASAGVVALLSGRSAQAAGPFVDAPLTLPPLHFSADAGLGFGTFQNYATDPNNPTGPAVLQGGTQVGWGMNLEAAVGLPYVGELGLRIGYRFGPGVGANSGDPEATSTPAGALGNADHFGRLFDPIQSEPGISAFANPEVRLRGSLFDLHTVQLGLETRVIIPTGDGSVFAITPGVPLRIHLPGFMRIDTGLYLPVAFFSTASYSLDVPVQAFFQVGDAFFGPMTGIRYNVINVADADGNVTQTNSVDVPLGIAVGYTLAGFIDLKAQLRTERINDANWASQYLGGGLGVGLRLP